MAQRWELTSERIAHLNACSAQGMRLREAAKELRTTPRTIRRAAAEAGKSEWLAHRFPKHRRTDAVEGPRKISADYGLKTLSVNWSSPYVRAAAMPWR